MLISRDLRLLQNFRIKTSFTRRQFHIFVIYTHTTYLRNHQTLSSTTTHNSEDHRTKMMISVKVDEELLKIYVICTEVLILKVIYVAYLVGAFRVFYKTVPSPEDLSLFKHTSMELNPQVERMRRVHLNSLENVPFFIIASFFYLLAEPSTVAASWIFYTYTAARIGYVISYGFLKSTVLRIICFEIAVLTNIYVAVIAIWHFTNLQIQK